MDDECSTPDKWGRKVFHVNDSGLKVPRIVRHMKAGDRWENHKISLGRHYNEWYQLMKV